MSVELIAEIGVLLALAWPGLRAACSPAFRRVFPLDAVRIGLVSVLYVGAVLAVAVHEPRWLRVPAIVAAVVGLVVLWRARPGYGRAAGLPPGSLWPLPVRPWSDPEFYKRQAARYGDVFKLTQFGRPMICVVGLERINRLLLEHEERLLVPPLPFSRFIEGGYLRYMPEEPHARYRRVFRSLFHSEAVATAAPRLAAGFRRALAAMTEAAAPVAVAEPLQRMLFAAWSDLFYGIDRQHRDFARLQEAHRLIDIRSARWASRRRVERALRDIESILQRRVSTFTAAETSPPSCFLAALACSDPAALADRTLLGNFVYIMQVSWGDVGGLLLWAFKMLGDHPAWRERVAAALAAGDGSAHDLATRIVQETLRLEQSEHRYRRAAVDLTLDRFRIPKGWLVRMCIRESHQDAKVFHAPATFDPDRFLGGGFTHAQYAPFGAFRLACIGEELTKAVGAIFVVVLASEYDWRVVDDGPPEINSWAHNAPSPRLRVAMTSRSARTLSPA